MTSLGRAGGALDDAGFAVNAGTAKAGQTGELLTARILDARAANHGFTVLHDLRIPRAKANIDHIVVAGNRVWVIDSKLWMPGLYSTVRTHTWHRYKGKFQPAPHADKRGLPLGHARIAELLEPLEARMQRPLMVVHSSRPGERVALWAFQPASDPGVKVRAIHPTKLRFPAREADPRIVAALAPLTN